MSFFAIICPYLISFLVGDRVMTLVTRWFPDRDKAVNFFFSWGVGLGVSAALTFASFIILDCFNKIFILTEHALLLGGIVYLDHLLKKKYPPVEPERPSALVRNKGIALQLILILAAVPLVLTYKFDPFGGWDAWQVWNFKAKVLFLGGTHWRDIFLPSLWQTSPHYPLLLPLINAWAWIFQSEASRITPFLTSFVFTYATMGLLFSTLFWLTKRWEMILAPIVLISIPGVATLVTSQYCDILVGYYILAAIIGFIVARDKTTTGFALAAGLCAGFLAFSKPEGELAAVFIAGLGLVHLVAAKGKAWKNRDTRRIIEFFLAGVAFMFIPIAIFHFFLSPGNQTFTNGFFSADHPTTLTRFKLVLQYFGLYLIHKDLNPLFVLLFIGLTIANRRAIKGKEIIPSFLLLYMASVTVYYGLNTYFEILWWLRVTLSRIYLTLWPLLIFWVFLSVGEILPKRNADEQKGTAPII